MQTKEWNEVVDRQIEQAFTSESTLKIDAALYTIDRELSYQAIQDDADRTAYLLRWKNILTLERSMKSIPVVDVKAVVRVYSGKPGCGCGCRGSYRAASAHAGSGDTISDSQVTRVVNKINKAIAAKNAGEAIEGRIGYEDGIAVYESDSRYLWAYTKDAQ